MESLPSVSDVLQALQKQGIAVPRGEVRITAFGDSPELSAELIRLIIEGEKTAGSTLAWSLEAEHERPARIGDVEIVVDYSGHPVVLTRITKSYTAPFGEITQEHAALEGEGDRSLEYWREAHWEFFSRECLRIGRTPHEKMPVVCIVFEVIDVVPAA